MGALLDRPLGTVKIAGGTAGTPAGGVTSIQGVSGGTPVPVSVALPATLIDQAQGTVGTSAQALGSSQALVFGCYITNTHASNLLYVGSSSMNTTRWVHRLLPGQTSPLLPVANFMGVNVLGSAASTTYSFGGC